MHTCGHGRTTGDCEICNLKEDLRKSIANHKRDVDALTKQLSASLAAHEETKRKLKVLEENLLRVRHDHAGCEGNLNGARALHKRQMDKLEAKLKERQEQIVAYEEVQADQRRLVRELDVAIFGDSAAEQASLCDLVKLIPAEFAKFKELQEQKQPVAKIVRVNDCNLRIDYYQEDIDVLPIGTKLYAYPIDVEALLQQARKEENEACANVCDELAKFFGINGEQASHPLHARELATYLICAAAIRARMK